MPCFWVSVAVSVQEDDDGGEESVVLDDVEEVDLGFVALVTRGVERGGGVVVDGVDCGGPAGETGKDVV